MLLDAVFGLRATDEEEEIGIGITLHGEAAFS